jgi:LEA14-like dessication related protein
MARHILLPVFVALALLGCASLAARDPLEVVVAGIEPMPDKGEGLELRLLVRLRVQNPNPDAISYGGAFVKVEVQDRTFATGVTDVGGAIPGFGEAVVEVPVTVSMLRMVRQVIGMQDAAQADQIRYSMSGKLGSHRFSASGEFSLQPKPQADPAAAT